MLNIFVPLLSIFQSGSKGCKIRNETGERVSGSLVPIPSRPLNVDFTIVRSLWSPWSVNDRATFPGMETASNGKI